MVRTAGILLFGITVFALSASSVVSLAARQSAAAAGTSTAASDVAWLLFADDLHLDFRNTGACDCWFETRQRRCVAMASTR